MIIRMIIKMMVNIIMRIREIKLILCGDNKNSNKNNNNKNSNKDSNNKNNNNKNNNNKISAQKKIILYVAAITVDIINVLSIINILDISMIIIMIISMKIIIPINTKNDCPNKY